MFYAGVPEDFSKELRVYEYPDWMEKPDKPCYRSTSVVGECFKICRSLDHVSRLAVVINSVATGMLYV